MLLRLSSSIIGESGSAKDTNYADYDFEREDLESLSSGSFYFVSTCVWRSLYYPCATVSSVKSTYHDHFHHYRHHYHYHQHHYYYQVASAAML
jgi:hypothetical protein